MATRTVTIYGSGSARTSYKTPDTPDYNQTVINTRVEKTGGYYGYYCEYYGGYEKFVPPKEIFEKKVVSVTLHLYARYIPLHFIDTTAGYDIYAIQRNWDPKTTTENQRPETGGGQDITFSPSNFSWGTIKINADDVKNAAKMASFGVYISSNTGLEYYTSNSDHKPYIVVTVEDTVGGYDIKPSWPKNGQFESPLEDCNLEWDLIPIPGTIEFASREFDPPIWPQKKAVVSWTYNGNTKTATKTDGGWMYNIPKEQLPNPGNVSWNVQVESVNGFVQSSEPANFTTYDGTLYAEVISPINTYTDGSQTVDLHWRWSISTGTRPARADFQVSDDGGTTWDDLGSITDPGDLTYHAAPNELPAGSILWRVRGYNTNGVAGPWSAAAAVVVRRAPDTPAISGVTNLPKPTVSWQAEGQQAYQLQIGTWDSGTVFGTAKTDQCPEFLPDGPTAVRLRVQNSFGMWSQWAETTVTITNIPGEAIAARALARRADIRITWETKGEYPEYLVYRDGEVIGVTAGKQYIDHTAIGKAAYTVRGVNYNSTYTDSPPVTEILTIQSGLIALEGEWDWMLLDRRVSARPARSGGEDADVTYSSYSGRALPVAELSGHRQRSHSYTYSLPTKEDVDRLARMSGHRVVYKHKSGERAAGILGNVSWAWNRPRWDVSFTVTEVDHGPVL